MNTCNDSVEQQDPDYATPGPSNSLQQQKHYEKTARTNTSRKINAIIEREFTREIDTKENEILLIQNRLNQAFKTLHLLRYVIITDFYNRKQCILPAQPGSDDSIQTRIHPAIKQMIGQSPLSLSKLSFCSTVSAINMNSNQQSNSEVTSVLYPVATKLDNNESQKSDEFPNNDNNSKKRQLRSQETNSNGSLKKIPRHIPPKYSGPEPQVLSRGDRHKIRKRIVVGNISKWIPPDWRDDNASHKWTMYVRGSKEDAQIDDFVAKIRFFLHPSYRPNDVVEVTSPPFHLSRRGWGEFPLRVQLHFQNTSNKPMDIIHNLKLDRTYTGLQTLGSETVVDIWIKAQESSEQLQSDITNFIKKEEINDNTKLNEQENNVTIEENSTHQKNKNVITYNHNHIFMDHDYISFYRSEWSNSDPNDNNPNNNVDKNINKFNNDNEVMKQQNLNCSNLKMNNCKGLKPLEIIIPPRFPSLKVQKPKIKMSLKSPVKQILVLNENQYIPVNIVKNNETANTETSKMAGTSLLKFKLNSSKSLLLDANIDNVPALQIAHFNTPNKNNGKICPKSKVTVGKDKMRISTKREYYEDILKAIDDVNIMNIESLMRFIIKRIPIIDENASDPDYRKIHPYVCSSEKEFINCNIGKQRALEWYRAKAVHSYLKKKFHQSEQLWTIKEIMIWCRVHGHTPLIKSSIATNNIALTDSQSSKISANKMSSDMCDKSSFNTNTPPHSLILWQKTVSVTLDESYQSDESIDVTSVDEGDVRKDRNNGISDVKENNESDLAVVQVPRNIWPLHSFVCNTARLIGIRLMPEELVPGISHCVAARLIVKSVQCLLEDLLRSSFAQAWERNSKVGSDPDVIILEDVRGALISRDEFDIFTNSGLMEVPTQHETNSDHD